jgi:hypothetical protein
MQLTIELPEFLGEQLKSFSQPNELMVRVLSSHLATEKMIVKPRKETAKIKEAIEQLKVFRQGHRLNGLSIKELIEEGRR